MGETTSPVGFDAAMIRTRMRARRAVAPPAASFGEQLKSLRKAAGMTQGQLAGAIGVTRSALAQWETDRAGVSMQRLADISELLGVPLEKLIGESAYSLSEEEMNLVGTYRSCGPRSRRVLVTLASQLSALPV